MRRMEVAMKSIRSGTSSLSPVYALLFAVVTLLSPSAAQGGIKVAETPDMTLELGMRLQQRMEYTRVAAIGGTDWQRDFMVRRARLKANGKMLTATYGFEWKIDATDQIGASPSASVENAWVQYPLGGGVELRAGLYDQPFSRDRLTSDSRQLAVDRGEVSNVPDALGLADNVVGFHLLGKTKDGRVGYAVGLFDNRFITGARQDVPMVVARLDFNGGSSKDVFQDAHFGTEKWYSLGIDGSFQGSIENAAGVDDSSHTAGGIDGMIDVPFGECRLLVRGELNAIRTEKDNGPGENNATVRMIGAGILFKERFQPFIRFDQVRGDRWARGGAQDITFVGANFYQKGHSLKFQGDVRLQAGTEDAVDGVRLQSQLDF